METTRLEETSYEELGSETTRNEEIQTIRKALERGDKEMKGVALGLCQWKDEYLWHQGKIWVPNKEGIRTNLLRQTTIFRKRDTEERQKGRNSYNANTIGFICAIR